VLGLLWVGICLAALVNVSSQASGIGWLFLGVLLGGATLFGCLAPLPPPRDDS
jgi:hypothetical protein